MKKNRKLWILLAALAAVVLVAVLCLLLPRLQVEPGVPRSGAIVRQEAAEDGRPTALFDRRLLFRMASCCCVSDERAGWTATHV